MILLILAYLAVNLLSLTALPVFSDEAIYIHWSQVAMRVPEKYAFLPMLDGKPPLHTWLLMPFLRVFQDPLFAGRLFSVLTGLGTMLVLVKIIRYMGGGKREQYLTAVFSTVLPYLYFHNRMALAESLMGLLLVVCLYAGLQIFQTKSMVSIGVFALSFGAALWTKTTALFFVPVFAFLPMLAHVINKGKFTKQTLTKLYLGKEIRKLIVAGVIGGALFGLLAFSPLFPSLFNRSVDYTFSIGQVLGGEWRYILFTSMPNILLWITWYLSPFVIVLALFGGTKSRVLALMCLAYFLPLALVGRVLSARYFFPIAVLFVPMAVLGFQELVRSRVVLAKVLVGGALLYSAIFMAFSLTDTSRIPFTQQDRVQYLTDWSSGYGIPEVTEFIVEKAKSRDHITVATEGFFGTLPDGIQIYFDKNAVADRVEIRGIGQPISSFPTELFELANTEDVYVVVNENRFLVGDDGSYTVINTYARPFSAPPLLLLQLNPKKTEGEQQ